MDFLFGIRQLFFNEMGEDDPPPKKLPEIQPIKDPLPTKRPEELPAIKDPDINPFPEEMPSIQEPPTQIPHEDK